MAALPPHNDIIDLPDEPEDPPSPNDVIAAASYRLNMAAAHMTGDATNEHMAEAMVYELNVVQARAGAAGAAPAWFLPAMQAALQPLTDHVNALSDAVNQIARMSGLASNRHAGAGTHLPFELVHFPDGSNPLSPPYNLPALINIQSVRALSAADSRRYFRGYYPDVPQQDLPTPAERIPLILRAIGYWQT